MNGFDASTSAISTITSHFSGRSTSARLFDFSRLHSNWVELAWRLKKKQQNEPSKLETSSDPEHDLNVNRMAFNQPNRVIHDSNCPIRTNLIVHFFKSTEKIDWNKHQYFKSIVTLVEASLNLISSTQNSHFSFLVLNLMSFRVSLSHSLSTEKWIGRVKSKQTRDVLLPPRNHKLSSDALQISLTASLRRRWGSTRGYHPSNKMNNNR